MHESRVRQHVFHRLIRNGAKLEAVGLLVFDKDRIVQPSAEDIRADAILATKA
jgi:hypothetical protein